MASPRGAFILIEGIDRCGKSTQAERLTSYLIAKHRNSVVKHLRYPDRTTATGKMIDSYLKNDVEVENHTIHLLFSANRWEKYQECIRDLSAGNHLVVDRYCFSGVAFSIAKGLDPQWCYNPEIGLVAPDAVIFIDISAELASKRGGYGVERYENIEMQRRVQQAFHKLKQPSWYVLNGKDSLDTIERQVCKIADDTIVRVAHEPIHFVPAFSFSD